MVGRREGAPAGLPARAALAVALRAGRWALLAIAVLAVAAIACWRLIDDEPLDPQVRQALAMPVAPPSKNNGYFPMIGLVVEEGVDPEFAGRRYVAAHDRLLAAQKNLDYFDGDAAFASPRLALPAEKPCPAEPATGPSCLADYRRNATLVRRQLDALAPYVERYRRLKSYEELVAPFSRTSTQSEHPAWQAVVRMGDLVDASIALRAESPAQRGEALRELAEEVAFWRRLLGRTDWLLSQMVAARMLTFKLTLASDLMAAHPEIVRDHGTALARITEPIRPEEATIANAIRLELFVGASVIGDVASNEHAPVQETQEEGPLFWLLRVLQPIAPAGAIKPQATLNAFVPLVLQTAALAEGPPARFVAQAAALEAAKSEARRFRLRDPFFNPYGRLLVLGFSDSDLSGYSYRLWDMVALSRLVELQRRLIEGKVAAADVPTVAASARELGDLYTGEPARWDAGAGRLSFESRGKRWLRDGRVAVTHKP